MAQFKKLVYLVELDMLGGAPKWSLLTPLVKTHDGTMGLRLRILHKEVV
jgi:hypothetical protein